MFDRNEVLVLLDARRDELLGVTRAILKPGSIDRNVSTFHYKALDIPNVTIAEQAERVQPPSPSRA
ncbi:hypothetical protein AA103196_2723 [Ameyamaea chiangmaiensis NBRC 103196]|uniref:Uncharacterized protein n=1 Tax=Ameyamaea chiangmaiensis TaxID=442969 RepID=A0A850P3B2_9PROT|nr:hypothetical protein [Ameyamaea chiangmaiensis]MBS4074214.1 hypothetical protein [Ameyamaea chiangmaiensis]NVN39157.1 hypothetical protein [Ameyamaea chiangmaiensis]GBQ71269.1 hypothetical protein AA103196_2723 [Ameyamaea chiangmaiensis NBRC 103196]